MGYLLSHNKTPPFVRYRNPDRTLVIGQLGGFYVMVPGKAFQASSCYLVIKSAFDVSKSDTN